MSWTQWEKHVVKCPHCGKDALDHMTACPHCGGELEPASKQLDPAKMKKVRFWVSLVLYAVAAALIIYYLIRNFGGIG